MIERTITLGERVEGVTYQVFLLTSPDDSRTAKLERLIQAGQPSAWKQRQVMPGFGDLRDAKTTDELRVPAVGSSRR